MLSLSQRQSLLQRLSPQQVQYLKMLQLPVLALEQRIKEEIELNPLLEELTEAGQEQESTFEQETATLEPRGEEGGDDADAPRATDERDADREIDWDEYASGEYEGYKAPSFTGSENEEQEEYPQRAEESLAELLLAQLRMQDLTDDEIALAEEIIGNIDDHGYLLRDLRDIVDDLNKFIATTSTHLPEVTEPPITLGDGHFDAYASAAPGMPFGRERLVRAVAERASETGEEDDDEEMMQEEVEETEFEDGANPIGPGYGTGHGDAGTAAADVERDTGHTIATMSLAEMSRLSIDELSRLLERGTAATESPAAPASPASGFGTPKANGTSHTAPELPEPAAIPEVFTLAEADRVLHAIQRLDPPGIGSRDLRECLMVQLELHPDPTEAHRLAYRILRDAYTEFTMRHFEKIAHKLGCTVEDLRDPIEVIRTLNPKPGAGSSTLVEGNYVTPDFVIERDDDEVIIIPNDRQLPALRINRAYQEMIRRGEGKRKDVDRDTRRFIREKFESAKWFIASIHQRRQTMLKVMRAIVDLQHDFFISGPNSIRPMIYKDVAEQIGMDISTVCRVVNGKYAQTDYGTFELRYFFSEKLETATGEEVSTKIVKARIQEMIDAEDKHHPLSDDAIAHAMEQTGFNVARRTVAKYREQMNIPVARLRRAI